MIDEEEFAWLTQCKAAKANYRATFESLSEVCTMHTPCSYRAATVKLPCIPCMCPALAVLHEAPSIGGFEGSWPTTLDPPSISPLAVFPSPGALGR